MPVFYHTRRRRWQALVQQLPHRLQSTPADSGMPHQAHLFTELPGEHPRRQFDLLPTSVCQQTAPGSLPAAAPATKADLHLLAI